MDPTEALLARLNGVGTPVASAQASGAEAANVANASQTGQAAAQVVAGNARLMATAWMAGAFVALGLIAELLAHVGPRSAR